MFGLTHEHRQDFDHGDNHYLFHRCLLHNHTENDCPTEPLQSLQQTSLVKILSTRKTQRAQARKILKHIGIQGKLVELTLNVDPKTSKG